MSPMLLPIALLIGSAVAMYLAGAYFVNGVEWVGRKLALSQHATGSILAAFGTALPESAVTFVAVVFGTSPAQKSIGVGAALGGPLVLATIAYAVVGVTLLLYRRRLPKTDVVRDEIKRLSRAQGWFLIIFLVDIGLGLALFAYKRWIGLLVLIAYGAFFLKEMRSDEGKHEEAELEPLKLTPRQNTPALWAAVAQTLAALVVIFLASHLFVNQLDVLAPSLGIHPQLLALLLTPVATELPETFNAVIWVRQGKYRLALANISGSMVIQATVPAALGIFFTPWLFDKSLLLAALVTLAAVAILFFTFRRGIISRTLLASMAALYGLFAVILVAFQLG